jgi:AraC family transcriptional regulator
MLYTAAKGNSIMQEHAHETYRMRIMRAILWLEEHMNEAVSLDDMAAQAHFSPYHFHRIFRGVAGESVMAYIRRLRLEKAVHRLAYGSASVTDIAFDAGYEAHEAFSRAFRAQFGMSPSALRRHVRKAGMIPAGVLGESAMTKVVAGFTLESLGLEPEVKVLTPVRVAFVRHTGPYAQCEAAWKILCDWAFPQGLVTAQTQFMGICYDDPEVTAPDKIRYDACISVPDNVQAEHPVAIREVEGGEYVCAVWKGPYTGLTNAYAALCGQWGGRSGREFRAAPSVEVYLNDCTSTPEQELLTEIRMPLMPR